MRLTSPTEIARTAEGLYEKNFRDEAETHHKGEFVVIEVNTKKAYFGNRPIEAHTKARREHPSGLFHLMKVGQPGAFKLIHVNQRHQSDDRPVWQWVF